MRWHPCERARIQITLEEGGEWFDIDIHSLRMPRGAEWDALNGWRGPNERFPFEPQHEHGNEGADKRRAAWRAACDAQISQLEAVDACINKEPTDGSQSTTD